MMMLATACCQLWEILLLKVNRSVNFAAVASGALHAELLPKFRRIRNSNPRAALFAGDSACGLLRAFFCPFPWKEKEHGRQNDPNRAKYEQKLHILLQTSCSILSQLEFRGGLV
jgi:hypothetical protein